MKQNKRKNNKTFLISGLLFGIALIGVSGESLSSYAFGFFIFLINRRIVAKKNEKTKNDDNKQFNKT